MMPTMQRPQLGIARGVVALVVAICVGFLAVILWGAYAAVDRLSTEAIEGAAGQTQAELAHFFGPVEMNLDAALGWAARGALDPANVPDMNARFMPLLAAMPQVSSMLVATPAGVEYMLLKTPQGWRTRSTDASQRAGVADWAEWDRDGAARQSERKELNYDPRERPWFKGAMAAEPGARHWTPPYTFFTTKEPGVTVSSRIPTPDGPLILAFDVLLLDISRFTTRLHVSERGKVFVFTDGQRIVGLPPGSGFGTDEARKAAVLDHVSELDVPVVTAALAARAAAPERSVLSYESQGERWLATFRPHPLSPQSLWIGVAVPTADFRGPLTYQRWALVALALLGVLGALVLGLFFTRKHRQAIDQAVEQARGQLGQYRLDQQIGQGGMGAVYRGRHTLMRRDVAIKLVRPDRVSPEFVQRFEREVRLTSRLSHPNTIQIYDYGVSEDGTLYYVMELLNGVTLAHFIDLAGPIDPARTIYLVRQICESLREAHEVGLVHRDIKPANIHVCERGGRYDVIKVLDFGLVKDVALGEDQTELTGEVAYGTPGFVAPEAIRDSSRATAVSDIYAVGAIAYALLTARSMFPETNKVKLLLRQMHEDPPPPSTFSPTPVPPELEALVMAMVHRDPAWRPQSMDQVLGLLDVCADASGWTARKAESWWVRHAEYFRPEPVPAHDEQAVTLAVDTRRRGS